jgi:hypothetical protein
MKYIPYNINLVSSNLHGSTRHTLNYNLSPAGVVMPNLSFGCLFCFYQEHFRLYAVQRDYRPSI